MKNVNVNFRNANGVVISEKNTCKETIIYRKTSCNGEWTVEPIASGYDLKDACLNLIDSGMANMDKLKRNFDLFCEIHNIKNPNQRRREINFDKWLSGGFEVPNTSRKFSAKLSGDYLFNAICDTETTVAVNWEILKDDTSTDMGDSVELGY